MKNLKLKRVYEDAEKEDGYRILVDRLWPRGVSKEDAKIDEWLKEIAPSTELRKWFDHDPKKFSEFKTRYKKELQDQKEQLKHISDLTKKKKVCLCYGAKDEEHNQAVVIAEVLKSS